MGRIAKLLSFVRLTRNDTNVADVKVNPGGGANITVEHFAPIGDDSFPLSGDYVTVVNVIRSGGGVVVAYLDPNSAPKAVEGDKRIYSRDPSNGLSIAELWLKNDGSTVLSNANGSMTLQANGDFLINGVTIDTNGNITSPALIKGDGVEGTNSLKAGTSEVIGHTHVINSGSSAPGPTGALV